MRGFIALEALDFSVAVGWGVLVRVGCVLVGRSLERACVSPYKPWPR